MAKQAVIDYSAQVTRVYGVVPRERDTPEHPWNTHKGGFPKPRNWRARSSWYVRGGPGTQSSERGGSQTFAGEAVGADVAPAPKAEPEIKVAWNTLSPVYKAMKAHSPRASALVDAVVSPVPAPAPVRVREPDPVPEALIDFTAAVDAALAAAAVVAAPEPVADPAPSCACSCEASQVAAYLRELAGRYGPRRAHKLLAMADFVTAAAG